MGESTAIAWTDHTFNPWMGCTKVSPGCDNCYAEALGKRTGRVDWGDEAERVPTSDAYWRNPIKWNTAAEAARQRHRVFCASLADVFEDRDDLHSLRLRLWALVESTPWLDWQVLTKRPENVHGLVMERWNFGGWPHNLWIGTTVEDQERAEQRIPVLLTIPAPVRFLSCEPLLGPLDLGLVDHSSHERDYDGGYTYICLDCSTEDESVRWFVRDPTPIQWVICGGESGPGYRPLDLDHARSLRDQCVAGGVPFFFKQVGGRTPKAGGDVLDGQTWKQFPS
jgi:protein gp37